MPACWSGEANMKLLCTTGWYREMWSCLVTVRLNASVAGARRQDSRKLVSIFSGSANRTSSSLKFIITGCMNIVNRAYLMNLCS